MLAILFAIAPAVYAWQAAGLAEALAVAVASYLVFVVVAWRESRKAHPVDLVFTPFLEDLRRKRLILQVVVPSIVGWPLAWLLVHLRGKGIDGCVGFGLLGGRDEQYSTSTRLRNGRA